MSENVSFAGQISPAHVAQVVEKLMGLAYIREEMAKSRP